MENLKGLIDDITPPILLRRLKAIRAPRRPSAAAPGSREQNAAWYDQSFEHNQHWRQHYSLSEYYFLWTVIADRIVRARVRSVLEIGCGPGQLACLLRDKGIARYHGFDFSPRRVEQARAVCAGFDFSVQDAFQTYLFDTLDYDCAVCTEFLEHVERDVEVLQRIKPGTRFFGTVPNFPFASHVRHFASEEEVRARYAPHFHELRVDPFLANDKNKTFYLLEGRTA